MITYCVPPLGLGPAQIELPISESVSQNQHQQAHPHKAAPAPTVDAPHRPAHAINLS